MLAPSVRATIRPRSLSVPVTSHTQTRTIFGWRASRLASHDSISDPLYPRLIRHRTLKTRAKLLKTLRRRQQFEWDPEIKPLVSDKHVRSASNWAGGPRKWDKYRSNQETQEEPEENNDGRELSDREKAWKKRMESMRKRIESDPYEAVFGKRFEPFWSSLAPEWMKEELGLSKKEPEKPNAQAANVQGKREKTKPTEQSRERQEPATSASPEKKPGRQTGPYAYSSSTSWDSQSNKAKRSEWNSVSGKITSYEYDPVSGRMVPVEPQAGAPTSIEQEKKDSPFDVFFKPIVNGETTTHEPSSDKSEAIDIPVKTVKNAEQPLRTQPVDGNPTLYERHQPIASIADSHSQQGELEALTANDVRASMGKVKHHSINGTPVSEEWSSEQQALRQQIREWDDSVTRLRNRVTAIVDEAAAKQLGSYLPTTLERRAQLPQSADKIKPLQPALQRMQSKAELAAADPDDSAAHESTGTISAAQVPKGWSEQADILQSDRVKRTASQRPYPTMRWLEDMNARKAKYEEDRLAAEAELAAANSEKTKKLEKANAMLQAEVDAQKLAMTEQQTRSTKKIQSLRKELEVAYKQSSVHADAFRDRITSLEKELSAAQNTANEVSVAAIKERYSAKVRSLQKELEVAYKQSSVHADEFTQRIKSLESELCNLTDAKANEQGSAKKVVQGEGDVSPNVGKFTESDMWYKQRSFPPPPTAEQMAWSTEKARAERLIREVKSIYETAYGKINAQHQQPPKADITALDRALARRDRRVKYAFKEDGLEAELSGKTAQEADASSKVKDPVSYRFKDDGLEAELEGKPEVEATADTKHKYGFKRDNLEAELNGEPEVETTPGDKHKYGFKPDDLEAELKGKPEAETTVNDKHKYGFKPDNLEAELKGKPEAEATASDKHEYGFNPDTLEAELQARDETATTSRDRFIPDGLESELVKQGQTAAHSPQGARFKPDGLEAELQRLAKEKPEYASDAYEAEASKIASNPIPVGKMEKTMASSLGAELQSPAQTSPPPGTTVQWQVPPLYKIVAYDSGNDRFSIKSTTSWDSSIQEFPVTIPKALDQLYQPARWLVHFTDLQSEGFQAVYAREDVLVLRKVLDNDNALTTPETKTSKTTPFEPSPAVNPVDGTSRTTDEVRTVTGDYASPTGFVNLDPVQELTSKLPSSLQPPASESAAPEPRADEVEAGAEAEEPRRLTRKERKEQQKRSREWGREQVIKEKARVWGFFRGFFACGFLLVLGSYAAGAVGELKEAKQPAEREGKSPTEANRRWRLDEGVWKKTE